MNDITSEAWTGLRMMTTNKKSLQSPKSRTVKKERVRGWGEKMKYETHIQPNLAKISEWVATMTEAQIAQKLGINVRSFDRYKVDHEELRDALRTGKQDLIEELKATLKMKAKGFRYTEEKIIEKFDEAGNSTGKNSRNIQNMRRLISGSNPSALEEFG